MKKKKTVKAVSKSKAKTKLKNPAVKSKASTAKSLPFKKGFHPEVKIYADAFALFSESAHLLMEIARKVVAERGRFVLALSGGSTPKGLFQQLTEEPYYSLMPWAKTFVFW